MCGIYGAVARPGRDLHAFRPAFAAMDERLRHRGPDDCGFYAAAGGQVALGHRRLAIIDLSSAGRQPLWNEDETIALVFNGEIYNYRVLRDELAVEHRFRSRTDSEVIVHGYEAYGDEMVTRLEGMFAFALWDARARRLLLVRDRLGKKPLYYAEFDDGLLFASEMKALLAWAGLRRAVDPAAIVDYLTYGYVPAPRTMLQGVKKLAAGTLLAYANGAAETRTYWDLPVRLGWRNEPRERAARRVRELVDLAIARRLVSDVPVGALLSGGVDSAVVVGTMASLTNSPIQTFTVGFEAGPSTEKVNADVYRARITARRFGTDHRELIVGPQTLDMDDLLQRLVWHLDEPNATPTVLSTFAVAELARREAVKVVLTGDGGDELFAGYPRYMFDRWVGYGTAIPPAARRAVARALDRLPSVGTVPLLRRFVAKSDAIAGSSPGERYLAWRQQFRPAEQSAILAPPLVRAAADHCPARSAALWLERVDAPRMQDRLAYADLKLWVADESNMRVDRATMAASVEARAPLLDHHVVEYAFSLPFERKVRGRETKHLLKRAYADLVPIEISAAPKRGFFSPARWWLETALADTVADALAPARVARAGVLNPAGIASLRTGEGWERRAKKLWAVLVLQLWAERFLV